MHTAGWPLDNNTYGGSFVYHAKNKQVYQDNANRYREQLTALDAYLIQETNLVPINQRVLVTAHDAFGYFGEAYGFEVYGLQGISTQSARLFIW